MASFLLSPIRVISRVLSAALSGIDPYTVTIESEVARGLPKFDVVGLARESVKEGRNRIVSALRAAGVEWSARRITVNLAPASVRKDGAAFDLPIALGLAAALGVVPGEALEDKLAWGELALDGSLRPVRGALLFADHAQAQGIRAVIVPRADAAEVAQVRALAVLAPRSLGEMIAALRGEALLEAPPSPGDPRPPDEALDWSEVKGQPLAKRVLEIAAAGLHNVLLTGPPGVGKTLLARRLPGALPPLDSPSLREVRRIRSAAGYPAAAGADPRPPFRAPHHHASLAGMTGGGLPFRPGELTLAHRGVLFLDELPEFRRDVIEALREPLESGVIGVVRVEGKFELPADFLFVGAMNLCPCGALGDTRKACLCTPPALERYRRKISGPIRDRLDLVAELARPPWQEVWKGAGGEGSAEIRARVAAARELQRKRQGGPGLLNGRLSPRELRRVAAPDAEGESLLSRASDKMGLSARAIDKVMRVARTAADLDASETVRLPHIAEALQYRTAVSMRL